MVLSTRVSESRCFVDKEPEFSDALLRPVRPITGVSHWHVKILFTHHETIYEVGEKHFKQISWSVPPGGGAYTLYCFQPIRT